MYLRHLYLTIVTVGGRAPTSLSPRAFGPPLEFRARRPAPEAAVRYVKFRSAMFRNSSEKSSISPEKYFTRFVK